MNKQQFNQAKYIREKIDHMNIKKLQLDKMKKREKDEEFNLARQLAHDAICYTVSRLEEDFNAL